jgi:hypothetical protein
MGYIHTGFVIIENSTSHDRVSMPPGIRPGPKPVLFYIRSTLSGDMAPTVAPEFSALEVLGRILDGWKAAESKQTQNRFGQEIYARLQHVEATVAPLVEAPKKLQATLVTEIVVTEGTWADSPPSLYTNLMRVDMCQGYGTMHGGCTAYLIDKCVSS